MKLNIKAFALTSAIIWSIGLFAGTWWIISFEGTTHEPTFFGLFYRGYNISPLGSLIGLLWAIPDGLIFGALFAWIYNFLATRFAKPAK